MSIWLADNPPSERWPLYTRGSIGEVLPDVIPPLLWDTYGQEAENGFRSACRDLGLLMPGDIPDDEPRTILGVFGGYCYLNASFLRLLGVRAPGGSVEAIERQFFGEYDAPAYAERPGDRNRRSTARLAKTVLEILGVGHLDDLEGLESDRRRVAAWLAQFPTDGPDGAPADDRTLLDYMAGFKPLFEHLLRRHVVTTMAATLASGAVGDLLTKIGHQDHLASILGGIGDVDSARHDPDTEHVRRSRRRSIAVAEVQARLNPIDRRLFAKALQATNVHSQAREQSKTTITNGVRGARRAHRLLAQRAAERGGSPNLERSCLLSFDEFSRYVADPTPWADVLAERSELRESLTDLIPPFFLDGQVLPITTWERRNRS